MLRECVRAGPDLPHGHRPVHPQRVGDGGDGTGDQHDRDHAQGGGAKQDRERGGKLNLFLRHEITPNPPVTGYYHKTVRHSRLIFLL